MQEFESISASSYDPSALATKLTAKAAEGWSVVAIVPTGGDVTAFVTRDKGAADADSKTSTEASESKAEASVAPADKADDKADDAPALTLPAKTEPVIEPKAEPVSEPSGWAIAPEPATPTLEPTGVQPAVTIAPTSTYQPAATPSYEPAAAATPAAAAAAAVPAAAHTPEPAAAPAVPAGWYADPAGRFELRYWVQHLDRARVSRRPAVHRSPRRLTPAATAASSVSRHPGGRRTLHAAH